MGGILMITKALGVVAAIYFILGVAAPVIHGAEKGDPEAGKKTYSALCISCHGPSGKGDGVATAGLPVKPKDWTAGTYMKTLEDKYLFDIIKGGGASVSKSPMMPPWGNQLKDGDISNLVSYIRSLAAK
jgi:cytochrome c oxidase cbb3-type subunit 3